MAIPQKIKDKIILGFLFVIFIASIIWFVSIIILAINISGLRYLNISGAP